MPSPNDIPCWYLAAALVITAYQSYRGFMFQWIFAKERENGGSSASEPQRTWTRTQKIVLLSSADCWFYLVTTLSGFIALFMAYHLLNKIQSITEVSTGVVTLLIFLVVYGVLGVAAQLPYLIQQGKFPWKQ